MRPDIPVSLTITKNIMSVNKVILLGNVGRDPEVKYLDSGVALATFSLATTDRAYTMSDGTQVPERTEWHNLVLWRRLAEVAEKYVHKGDKLYIEGKIRTRSYEDKEGAKRYTTEIFVEIMEMLSAKGTATPPATQPTHDPTTTMQDTQRTSPGVDENPADDLPF